MTSKSQETLNAEIKAILDMDPLALIGVEEVSILTTYSEGTIRQRRVPGLPKPLSAFRTLKWRVGDLQKWLCSRKITGGA